jgi:hypothetical protein
MFMVLLPTSLSIKMTNALQNFLRRMSTTPSWLIPTPPLNQNESINWDVPLAAHQAVANAEAAEAFAALDLRVNGTPDTKAKILHPDSLSFCSFLKDNSFQSIEHTHDYPSTSSKEAEAGHLPL